jgi:hypothetical protein
MASVHLYPLPSDEPLPAWVAVPVGLVVVGIAMASAAIGLMMNIDFAMKEGLDVWKTAAYAGVDVAEFVMPIVIVARGWPWYKRGPAVAVWGVFLMISSFCIFSSVANVEAKRMKEVAVAENAYKDAEGRKAAADATLADPAVAREHTSVAELETLAKETSDAAAREGGRGTCGPKCESAHADHRKLLERVGLAKSRDAANVTLRDVSPILVKGLPDPAGFAVILAGPLGVDVKTLSRGHSMATSLGAVVAIKLAVLFFTPVGAWLLFRGWRRKRKGMGANHAGADIRVEPTLATPSVVAPKEEDADFDAPAPVVRRITSKAQDLAPAEPTEILAEEPEASEVILHQENDFPPAEIADAADCSPAETEPVEEAPAEPPSVEDSTPANVTRLTPQPKVEETGRGAEVRVFVRETLASRGPTKRSALIEKGAKNGFDRHAIKRAVRALECRLEKCSDNARDVIVSLPRGRKAKGE